jgi:hypothetical protein
MWRYSARIPIGVSDLSIFNRLFGRGATAIIVGTAILRCADWQNGAHGAVALSCLRIASSASVPPNGS